MRRIFTAFCLSLAGIALILVLGGGNSGWADASTGYQAPAVTSEPLPPGVITQTVLSGLSAPVSMVFDPQGRLFFTQLTGEVRLYAGGLLQTDPVITFGSGNQAERPAQGVPTCIDRRLLGIEIDPNFNSNHYIYVYLTDPSECAVAQNKVIRFVESNGAGSDPTVIFSSPQSAEVDQGGNIHFGPDGKLYISVGHDNNPVTAQDVTVKQGKMHRINSDGTIPADNPVFTQTGALPSLYAMGLRNSFDFTFDTVGTTRLLAGENGPDCDDELNNIVGGFNYGWRPNYPCDDDNPDPTYNTIPPMWHMGQGGMTVAPTGIEVYTGTEIAPWHNGLFMCAYNDGVLRHFYLNSDRTEVSSVGEVQGVKCNMDLQTGPDGALYYFEGGGYPPGDLKRILFVPSPACNTMLSNVEPSPNSTSPANALHAVTAISPDDIWAVGWHNDPATPQTAATLIEHWDGQAWSVVSSPNGGLRDNFLYALSAVSSDDVWAAGFYTDPDDPSGNHTLTLTLHWNGLAWSVVSSPNVASYSNFLRDIKAIASDDVWAVGYSGTAFHGDDLRTLALHWDGTQWAIVPTPDIGPGANARLVATDAASADDVWATGDVTATGSQQALTLTMHWDGSAWSVVASPSVGTENNTLRGVAALPTGEAWAVGYYGPAGSGQTLTMRWDGTQWNIVPSPNTGDINFLLRVDAVSANSIWAVGNYFSGGTPKTLAMRWDGSTWSVIPSQDPGAQGNNLDAVAVVSTNDVWGVGNYTNAGSTSTLVEHFRPSTFSDVSGDNAFYQYVQCISCRGIIGGYSDGTFRPNNDVTRGQLSKIVSNSAGFNDAPGPQLFEDVPVGSTFYDWVNRLANRGYIGGYPCGGPGEPCGSNNKPYFRPNANATRGQISKIVSNAGGYSDTPSGQTFEDVPPANPFYLWIERLASRGIMGGYPCGGPGEPCGADDRPYFRWGNNATRGQTSKVVANTFFPNCQTVQKP